MDEITSLRLRYIFALLAPADLARAGEDIGDCLLLAMVMNASPGSRLDLEQSAPQS